MKPSDAVIGLIAPRNGANYLFSLDIISSVNR
jgi:hypothetical protein